MNRNVVLLPCITYMKQAISIFILSTFLFSTIGVIASSYHCKKVMPANKSCCSPADRGCCEKHSKLLKINDDFLAASSQCMAKIISDSPVATLTVLCPLPYLNGLAMCAVQDHGPPRLPVEPLLLIQSFRI